MKRLVIYTFFALLAQFSAAAWSQSFPSKPIKIIVPFAPGGNVDITARTIAPALGELLGQPVIVENRPGAGSMIGAEAAMKSAPDGYTLMMGSNSSLSVAPNLYTKWPYDPLTGITPISNLAIVPFVLVVKTALPVQSLGDLLKLAKEKPGQLGMASGGSGSSNHLVGELFQMLTGVKLNHVPYKGAGPAMVDLVGGQVDLLFDQASSTAANVRGGKIRALAVSSRQRWPTLPDTPTFAEAGVRDFEIDNVTGLVGPAGMAPEVVAKIQAAAVKALALPAVRERFATFGVQAVGSTPEQFAAFIREDLARWNKVVKGAGVTVD
jgi:tripartite-type tricarboxylate transporter receptor subunit TctC